MKCERCNNFFQMENSKFDGDSNTPNLCLTCSLKFSDESKSLKKKFTGKEQIKEAITLILEALKIDKNNPNFKDTPARVSRLYEELCEGLNADDEIKRMLSTTFPSANDEMIIQTGIKTHSLCPHHLLLVEYDISLGYIPNGKVIGLSKLSRLVELVTKKPALQEDITVEITSYLMEYLQCKGAMCVVKGRHGCMSARGAKSNALTITSSTCGVFSNSLNTRTEFLSLIKE